MIDVQTLTLRAVKVRALTQLLSDTSTTTRRTRAAVNDDTHGPVCFCF